MGYNFRVSWTPPSRLSFWGVNLVTKFRCFWTWHAPMLCLLLIVKYTVSPPLISCIFIFKCFLWTQTKWHHMLKPFLNSYHTQIQRRIFTFFWFELSAADCTEWLREVLLSKMSFLYWHPSGKPWYLRLNWRRKYYACERKYYKFYILVSKIGTNGGESWYPWSLKIRDDILLNLDGIWINKQG